MTIEGELVVRLAWDGRRVRKVAVRSTRPRVVTRLLVGRTARDAAEIVSRLHSVCAAAQGAAAASALDAAAARQTADSVGAARAIAVRLEAIQEHCTRLCLDWPTLMDEAPLAGSARAVRMALAPVLAGALDHLLGRTTMGPQRGDVMRALDAVRAAVVPSLLGIAPDAWLARSTAEELERWREEGAVPTACWYDRLCRETPRLGTSAVGLMPSASAEALRRNVVRAWREDEEFAEMPSWDGVAVETGALARTRNHALVAAAFAQHGNSVATRLVARLTELAALLAPGPTDAIDTTPIESFTVEGEGYAAAATARGLLVHRASLDGARVATFAIAAPTDWNFRRGGAFEAAAGEIEGNHDHEVRRRTALVAGAIDPCVACVIEVGHA